MDSAICLRFGHPATLRPTKPRHSLPISNISPQRHVVRFSSKPSPKESLVSGNFVGVFDRRKMFLKDKGATNGFPFKISGSQQACGGNHSGSDGAGSMIVNGKKYLRPIFQKWFASPITERHSHEEFRSSNILEQHKKDTEEILELINKDANEREGMEITGKIKEMCDKYHGDEKFFAEILFTETLISQKKYEEALQLSWLADKNSSNPDKTRSLLYKAIIHTMLKRDDDEAKKCWKEFAEGLDEPDLDPTFDQ